MNAKIWNLYKESQEYKRLDSFRIFLIRALAFFAGAFHYLFQLSRVLVQPRYTFVFEEQKQLLISKTYEKESNPSF